MSSSTSSALAPNSIASATLAACDVDPEESRVEKCCVSKALLTPGGVGRLEMKALILLVVIKERLSREYPLTFSLHIKYAWQIQIRTNY